MTPFPEQEFPAPVFTLVVAKSFGHSMLWPPKKGLYFFQKTSGTTG